MRLFENKVALQIPGKRGGACEFEETAKTRPWKSANLAEASVRGHFVSRPYCAGIATARPVRIDSFAA